MHGLSKNPLPDPVQGFCVMPPLIARIGTTLRMMKF